MAYSDFSLVKVKKEFGLTEETVLLFESIETLPLSNWLKTTLAYGKRLSLYSPSEKAKSEFIVAPILIEVQGSREDLALYSGKSLDVDKSKGLNGECDFILSKSKLTHTIQAPILGLVEAKKNDIELGMGQCISQMIGAKLFNEQEHTNLDTVFGCVTTGDVWLFLKLYNDTFFINEERYYIDNIGKILGVFKKIASYYDD
ncbi:MAG: hypothetical protein ACPGVO_14085 [Spirulinaceae cyanobacterium]